jgi:proteasome lid subunit RPN8/RPN11
MVEEFILLEEIADRIMEHCLAFPEEVCGFLGALPGRMADRIYPITNIAPERERDYLMDPEEQLAAFLDMEREGRELAAIYHSHPKSPPYPSPKDIELAFYPVCYLIVSLDPPVMRGFYIQGGLVREVDVILRKEDGDYLYL